MTVLEPSGRRDGGLTGLARELDSSTREAADDATAMTLGADWACEQLTAGVDPRTICAAALDVAVHRQLPGDGADELAVGADSFVASLVSSANSCALVADADDVSDPSTSAAAQFVAHVLSRGPAPERRSADVQDRSQVIDLTASGRHSDVFDRGSFDGDPFDSGSLDPVHELLDAMLTGDVVAALQLWREVVRHDDETAEDALLSGGAAGFPGSESALIAPAQLRSWLGTRSTPDPALTHAVLACIASHPQDPVRSEALRAEAAVLALDAVERAPETFGRLPRCDDTRLTTVATGIARTAPDVLEPLLIASLEEGLVPEDLADAVALVNAARFAITPFESTGPGAAVLACTGADAVQLCLQRATSPELRFEIALCATRAPHALDLEPLSELWVPPFDDGALDDLLVALEEGDPDAAAEAATAVPPDDRDSVDAAWRAVRNAIAADQWSALRGITQVVALERGMRASTHPARIWFLSAAARTAGHATAREQPLFERACGILSST